MNHKQPVCRISQHIQRARTPPYFKNDQRRVPVPLPNLLGRQRSLHLGRLIPRCWHLTPPEICNHTATQIYPQSHALCFHKPRVRVRKRKLVLGRRRDYRWKINNAHLSLRRECERG